MSQQNFGKCLQLHPWSTSHPLGCLGELNINHLVLTVIASSSCPGLILNWLFWLQLTMMSVPPASRGTISGLRGPVRHWNNDYRLLLRQVAMRQLKRICSGARSNCGLIQFIHGDCCPSLNFDWAACRSSGKTIDRRVSDFIRVHAGYRQPLWHYPVLENPGLPASEL